MVCIVIGRSALVRPTLPSTVGAAASCGAQLWGTPIGDVRNICHRGKAWTFPRRIRPDESGCQCSITAAKVPFALLVEIHRDAQHTMDHGPDATEPRVVAELLLFQGTG